MFGLIGKKRLLKKVEELQKSNRKEDMNVNYDTPMSENQKILNAYAQGYEDGCDNICNCLKSFK